MFSKCPPRSLEEQICDLQYQINLLKQQQTLNPSQGRGEWSATTQYNEGDIVYLDNISYFAIQASLGYTPSATENIGVYWQPFSFPGPEGPEGPQGAPGTSPPVKYQHNVCVVINAKERFFFSYVNNSNISNTNISSLCAQLPSSNSGIENAFAASGRILASDGTYCPVCSVTSNFAKTALQIGLFKIDSDEWEIKQLPSALSPIITEFIITL